MELLPNAVEDVHRANVFTSDAWRSFAKSPTTVIAAIIIVVMVSASMLAPIISPTDPYDLATVNLSQAFIPPAWIDGGRAEFLFGTDNQGRDVLSVILYGTRTSIFVGLLSLAVAMSIGVTLGLLSGYFEGVLGAIIMRIADIQMSFPAILVAMIVDGVARSFLSRQLHDEMALYVIVLAIAAASWVQFARTIRGSTLVERNKEYIQAARILGRSSSGILIHHVLPNVISPTLVLATIGLAVAILTEATLSFLGLGMPPTQPSLGTLINTGMSFLFSGDWWITIFPGAVLTVLVVSLNLVGDWLRDLFNPKLQSGR